MAFNTTKALTYMNIAEELKQEKAAKRMYKYRDPYTGGSYYTEIPMRKIV